MNKVILMGRLTKDPELRYTSSNNTAVCSFTLAVDKRFKKNEADFFNCQAWKNQAEFCSKHLVKGSKIALIGSLQNRSWDDTEGKKHYVTEVVADEVYFAESRKSEGSPNALSGQQEGGFLPMDDDELPF